MSDTHEQAEFDAAKPRRQIRSFVKREGRLSHRQARALEEFLPVYGLTHQSGRFDLDAIFKRKAPRILEIGFGMGKSLVQMAKEHPECDYIGIEVHRPGVGACLADMQDMQLTNIRVIEHDAVEILKENIADSSLHKLQLFFPDPWHKKRHHKRRIVQPEFADLVRQKLEVGGVFHMATDWQNYAEHMLQVMSQAPGYKNLSDSADYVPRPDSRPLTKFENRGQKLGHGVWDLMFERTE
ncbi:tRNA (guanosine(46)-N7)-methyltransferase TrmB [Celerinatantimonas diazotrophica]|uniref:tRNA (guanine-N(7)-)-methyltransferase n=1 Tax=Celerinatantimonas diazotrophica TaxID=412034 RepID=A0A4R1J9X6_9GAMM|nr:tRNA (guanosine(46)-N7)-methyltransferase TrmB [Celerinatantimonas diazotrophica]TCK47247.1 tRNA (guanine-N(7)-)-methyltransferase [Celerinatantimonas diazotrophica]CAG9296019.1 tRNA (guanine-N(7)-)-methyltransferase [Celerinatantimonas diazotrophica]